MTMPTSSNMQQFFVTYQLLLQLPTQIVMLCIHGQITIESFCGVFAMIFACLTAR